MRKFKWVVEFTIDEKWVADGFELTKDRALHMVSSSLPFSYPDEYKAKILKAPTQESILKAQGFEEALDIFKK